MASLDHIKTTRPGWISNWQKLRSQASFIAAAPKPDGSFTTSYKLIITEDTKGQVKVSEGGPQKKLPSFCAERHINPDGSFCLHFNSSDPITNDEQAKVWWESIEHFLKHQDFSNKFRSWPVEAQLSHGPIAAYAQVLMEKAADKLGWRKEVTEGIFSKIGWLSQPLPKPPKNKIRLVNGRSACQRSCKFIHSKPKSSSLCDKPPCDPKCKKKHYPILRRDCPNRVAVTNLAYWESMRREGEKEFYQSITKQGLLCCGTMKNCGLKK